MKRQLHAQCFICTIHNHERGDYDIKAQDPRSIKRVIDHLVPALLLFPGRFFFVPVKVVLFFLAEKPVRSLLDAASPLFENRFFPPCPYF